MSTHSNNKNKEKINFLTKLFSKKNKSPEIIPKEIHKIANSFIEIEAKKVIYRLKNFGYKAYIVGGAIRDILLERKPKDFDVATDAKPNEIKKIFCNARIIGKRFKLVHIIFKNRIIETATFRAETKNKNGLLITDNKFGKIEEDALRRDFGINALYYDIESENIIDYVKGYKDIQKRVIRTLKKDSISFLEDPVRMIRAVKYATLLNCKLEKKTINVIKKNAKNIVNCSSFRLLEEINKIIKSEKTKDILINLGKVKLLKYFIPIIDEEINGDNSFLYLSRIEKFDKEKENLISSDEKIGLFWAIMFYEKVVNKINNKEDFISMVDNSLKEYLYIIKTPRKIVDNITRIYFNYEKIKELSSDPEKNFKNNIVTKIKRSKFYKIFLYFVKIIGDDKTEEMFKKSKKRIFNNKKFSSKNKKSFKFIKSNKNTT